MSKVPPELVEENVRWRMIWFAIAIAKEMNITKKQLLTIGAFVVMSLGVSAFMMYIALDHNPMGEFLEYQDQPGEREGKI